MPIFNPNLSLQKYDHEYFIEHASMFKKYPFLTKEYNIWEMWNMYMKENGPVEGYDDEPCDVELIELQKDLCTIKRIDYDLLRADFPFLISENYTERDIDDWLLSETCYLCENQVKHADRVSLLHDDHALENKNKNKNKKGKRPAGYGRTVAIQCSKNDNILMELKGAGSEGPSLESHANGLISTGEAIREYTVEKKVSQIMKENGNVFRTVGTYAAISLGFRMLHPNRDVDKEPYETAGLVVRQVSRRINRVGGFMEPERALAVERILRPYGMTTAVSLFGGFFAGGSAPHLLNVQCAADGISLVDFGSYLVLPEDVEKFERDVAAYERPSVALAKAEELPMPDPEKRLDGKEWGMINDKFGDYLVDSSCDALARRFFWETCQKN